jgi:hypothetical protein
MENGGNDLQNFTGVITKAQFVIAEKNSGDDSTTQCPAFSGPR